MGVVCVCVVVGGYARRSPSPKKYAVTFDVPPTCVCGKAIDGGNLESVARVGFFLFQSRRLLWLTVIRPAMQIRFRFSPKFSSHTHTHIFKFVLSSKGGKKKKKKNKL